MLRKFQQKPVRYTRTAGQHFLSAEVERGLSLQPEDNGESSPQGRNGGGGGRSQEEEAEGCFTLILHRPPSAQRSSSETRDPKDFVLLGSKIQLHWC